MMKERHVFPNYLKTDEEAAFKEEFTGRANAYLHARGDHHFADASIWLQYAGLLAAMIVFYALALNAKHAALFMLYYILFMFLSVILALNAFHDAAITPLSSTKKSTHG